LNKTISYGFGYPEAANLTFRYQQNNAAIGLGYGSDYTTFSTVTGSVQYHFGGESKFNDKKPTFLRLAFTHIWEYSEYQDDTTEECISISIGRDCYFNQRLGMHLYIGFPFFFGNECGRLGCQITFIPAFCGSVFLIF
jgi:hypothetical protein